MPLVSSPDFIFLAVIYDTGRKALLELFLRKALGGLQAASLFAPSGKGKAKPCCGCSKRRGTAQPHRKQGHGNFAPRG